MKARNYRSTRSFAHRVERRADGSYVIRWSVHLWSATGGVGRYLIRSDRERVADEAAARRFAAKHKLEMPCNE